MADLFFSTRPAETRPSQANQPNDFHVEHELKDIKKMTDPLSDFKVQSFATADKVDSDVQDLDDVEQDFASGSAK